MFDAISFDKAWHGFSRPRPLRAMWRTNDRSVLDAVSIASGGVSSRLVDKTAGWLIQVETMWNRTESQKVN